MPQRHSKNNNDLAFFTYDEKRKLGYGTQKERLGRDSIKPFDAYITFRVILKARELDAFDQQNHGAVPQYNDRSYTRDKHGFHGANSVKVTSYEEEALRNMKAFWLPSATPEAPVKVEAPSTSTVCPEGNEKLKLKTLFPIYFTEENNEQKKSKCLSNRFMAVDKVCLVCNKGCKERNLVCLEKGGTGFAGHGDHLEAKDFKHLGSGSGLGLVRPAAKT
ncbi:hypothetical protein HHK36_032088 [Tetracentron sinense]|uniref:Uncharacterized protein n=1 Tax=Tetracentron sinense TaxID=13715 RepID=A0A834Y8Q4_TETSI|nr:hypothetical protein HHK36_032088 [Tetracentron sinense]